MWFKKFLLFIFLVLYFLLVSLEVKAQENIIPVESISRIEGCSLQVADSSLLFSVEIPENATYRVGSNLYISDCSVAGRDENEYNCNVLQFVIKPEGVRDWPISVANLNFEENAFICASFTKGDFKIDTNQVNGVLLDQQVLNVKVPINPIFLDENIRMPAGESVGGVGILRCQEGSLRFFSGKGIAVEGLFDSKTLEEEFSNLEDACSALLEDKIIIDDKNVTIRAPKKPEEIESSLLRSASLIDITCGVPGKENFNVCCDPNIVRSVRRDLLLGGEGIRDKLAKTLIDFIFNISSSAFNEEPFLTEGLGVYSSRDLCSKGSVPAKLKGVNREGEKEYELYGELTAKSLNLDNCYCVFPDGNFEDKLLGEKYVDACDNLAFFNKENPEIRKSCIEALKSCKTGFVTALGCVEPSLSGFVNNFLFRLGLGIAGIFSFLCIIYGAFLIKISQGDSDQVAKAQSMIRNCILGLLFIIFSVFIIDFIFAFLFV